MSRTGTVVAQVKGEGVEGDGRRFKSGIARILKGSAAVEEPMSSVAVSKESTAATIVTNIYGETSRP